MNPFLRIPRVAGWWTVFWVTGVAVFPPVSVLAFPPAPGFSVYGTVRDEFGWAVDSAEAAIVFKNAATGAIMARSAISTGAVLTENYRVSLPIDHRRTGADYRPDAAGPGTSFTIEVLIQGVSYFPTPFLAPALTETQSAAFLQLDLTLGDDSDGDGLPDLWERWQLEAGALDPSRLDLITGEGDPDGDGMSNREEFIAGTFVFLGLDKLSLHYVEIYPDRWSRMEFLAIIGKSYRLERSADMIAWEPAPFGLWQDRVSVQSDWIAPDTVLQSIQAPPGVGNRQWFYRLVVH